MHKLLASRRILAALFAAALSPLTASAAPAPPAPDADAALSPVEKARQGLDRVVTLKIDRQTLRQAVALLREKTKLNLVLDVPAIQQLGYSPDQLLFSAPADLHEVSARTALRTALAPYGLTFVIVGDSVLVTTEDMAGPRQMEQHVSVNLDKVEFAAALKQLARQTAVNLALDLRVEKEASAKVSLRVDDVPLEKVVRLLAEMAGLKPVRAGNALFVTRKEIAAEMRADPDLNPAPRVAITYSDLDSFQAVRMWQVQGKVQQQVISIPISVTGPAARQTPENPPALPDPVKNDGDK